jgi:hypothetical protein
VVFVATPHQGSLDAVEVMSRGESSLFEGQKALRKLARTFPGAYELLPTFPAALVDQQGNGLDVFAASNWQENVTLPTPEREDVEQGRLTAAKNVLAGLADPLDPKYGFAGRILAVYGDKDNSTFQSVTVIPNQDGVRNWFDFDGAKPGPGDEVVPVKSAILAGAPSVRIPFSEVSYFFDPGARYVSFHAFMTAVNRERASTRGAPTT